MHQSKQTRERRQSKRREKGKEGFQMQAQLLFFCC
nr:MAG TPA: hypothetical protein [Caudoviricetes sp.]